VISTVVVSMARLPWRNHRCSECRRSRAKAEQCYGSFRPIPIIFGSGAQTGLDAPMHKRLQQPGRIFSDHLESVLSAVSGAVFPAADKNLGTQTHRYKSGVAPFSPFEEL
jgi:hypothetical protein